MMSSRITVARPVFVSLASWVIGKIHQRVGKVAIGKALPNHGMRRK
jgi:hypothetical protein